jgi:hypothetical protein
LCTSSLKSSLTSPRSHVKPCQAPTIFPSIQRYTVYLEPLYGTNNPILYLDNIIWVISYPHYPLVNFIYVWWSNQWIPPLFHGSINARSVRDGVAVRPVAGAAPVAALGHVGNGGSVAWLGGEIEDQSTNRWKEMVIIMIISYDGKKYIYILYI